MAYLSSYPANLVKLTSVLIPRDECQLEEHLAEVSRILSELTHIVEEEVKVVTFTVQISAENAAATAHSADSLDVSEQRVLEWEFMRSVREKIEKR